MQLVIPSHPIPSHQTITIRDRCCSVVPTTFQETFSHRFFLINKYTNPKVHSRWSQFSSLYLGVMAIDGGGLTELVDNKTTEVGKWFQGHVVVYAIICPLLHSP